MRTEKPWSGSYTAQKSTLLKMSVAFAFCDIFEISKKIEIFSCVYFAFYSLAYFSTFKGILDFIFISYALLSSMYTIKV
jgi:hypothetical protein